MDPGLILLTSLSWIGRSGPSRCWTWRKANWVDLAVPGHIGTTGYRDAHEGEWRRAFASHTGKRSSLIGPTSQNDPSGSRPAASTTMCPATSHRGGDPDHDKGGKDSRASRPAKAKGGKRRARCRWGTSLLLDEQTTPREGTCDRASEPQRDAGRLRR